MATLVNPCITLDGFKYAVTSDSYSRTWERAFSSVLAANIIRLNFVDRGPGIRTYKMNLILQTWASNTFPYTQGVTQTIDTQIANLEVSWNKTATSLQFLDPFGNAPTIPGSSTPSGVYFTGYIQLIPPFSTSQKPFVYAQVEFMESTQVIA